jgi:hypothetical protein
MPAPPTAVLPTILFECPCCLRHFRVAAQFAGNLVLGVSRDGPHAGRGRPRPGRVA